MPVDIHLRPLVEKDAPGMLEWMTDPAIVCFFRFDASAVTLDGCRCFIENAAKQADCRHYAIADVNDEYLGTISLKQIDGDETEYAISTRACAHGTGVAMEATQKILEIAFGELKLRRVYLNVLQDNSRANGFYRKAGFRFVRTEENALTVRGESKNLNWYEIERDEYDR